MQLLKFTGGQRKHTSQSLPHGLHRQRFRGATTAAQSRLVAQASGTDLRPVRSPLPSHPQFCFQRHFQPATVSEDDSSTAASSLVQPPGRRCTTSTCRKTNPQKEHGVQRKSRLLQRYFCSWRVSRRVPTASGAGEAAEPGREPVPGDTCAPEPLPQQAPSGAAPCGLLHGPARLKQNNFPQPSSKQG